MASNNKPYQPPVGGIPSGLSANAKKILYHQLSDKCCSIPGCRTLIKKNVLHRQPHADRCYKHRNTAVKKSMNAGT